MTADREPYTVADRVGQVIIEELDLSLFDRPAVGAIVDRLAAERRPACPLPSVPTAPTEE